MFLFVYTLLKVVNSTAAKGYDCAFCDKSTKIGTLVVLYIKINMKPGTHRYRYGNRPPS